MIYNQTFQNNCESDSKKHKDSHPDKKVTSYVNVQLSFKSCFCFLSMPIYPIKPISSLCFNRSKVNKHELLQRETNALVSSFLVQRSDLLFKTNRPKHLH